MRQLRYLNGVLTLIAVLLTLNLYVAWNTAPGGQVVQFASEAQAQDTGIPNAGAQRREMIDLLKRMNTQMAEMNKTLTNGTMRARMEAGSSE